VSCEPPDDAAARGVPRAAKHIEALLLQDVLGGSARDGNASEPADVAPGCGWQRIVARTTSPSATRRHGRRGRQAAGRRSPELGDVVFVKDAAGTITHYAYRAGGLETIAKRVK
jgi:hypothetical protein